MQGKWLVEQGIPKASGSRGFPDLKDALTRIYLGPQ